MPENNEVLFVYKTDFAHNTFLILNFRIKKDGVNTYSKSAFMITGRFELVFPVPFPFFYFKVEYSTSPSGAKYSTKDFYT